MTVRIEITTSNAPIAWKPSIVSPRMSQASNSDEGVSMMLMMEALVAPMRPDGEDVEHDGQDGGEYGQAASECDFPRADEGQPTELAGEEDE